MILLGVALYSPGRAQTPTYSWTLVLPKNETRAKDVVARDDFEAREMVQGMNTVEAVFHHRLTLQRTSISGLLSKPAPFCELDFDAVHPFVPTSEEKKVLHEYFARGGFMLMSEDVYPYTRAETLAVKSWPIVDFVTKELPAVDPNFTVERVTEKHPIFHQFYTAKTPKALSNELALNPRLPDFTLVSYKGHPCVFFTANCVCNETEWVPLPRPFPENTSIMEESYALVVNLYVYASMH